MWQFRSMRCMKLLTVFGKSPSTGSAGFSIKVLVIRGKADGHEILLFTIEVQNLVELQYCVVILSCP